MQLNACNLEMPIKIVKMTEKLQNEKNSQNDYENCQNDGKKLVK